MTDISRAIYSCGWKVYPFDGRAEIQDLSHPKIVLTDAEALEVRELLNKGAERNAREE